MTDAPVTAISHYPNARWWAAGGVLVLLLGIAASTGWFISALTALDDEVDELTRISAASADRTVVVDEPVEWTIYLEPSGRSLSGVRFSVVDTSSDETVALIAAPNDVNYDVGTRTGRPVSQAVLEPGEYLVEIAPADVTLAIGDDVGGSVQQMWLGALLIALPTVLGGGAVAVVNGLRFVRSPARTGTPPPAAPPATPTPPRSGSLPPPSGPRRDSQG